MKDERLKTDDETLICCLIFPHLKHGKYQDCTQKVSQSETGMTSPSPLRRMKQELKPGFSLGKTQPNRTACKLPQCGCCDVSSFITTQHSFLIEMEMREQQKFFSTTNWLWQEFCQTLCHGVLPHFWCLRVTSVTDKCWKTLRAVQQAMRSFLKNERHDIFRVAFNSNQLYLHSAISKT